ncbi:MAG: ABC transporter ATP-binding protein [Thermoanaerobaculia bacterium]|nr:ABC transporter ATP-binding protein [Thermoanaerobaculia bacterium]
MSESGLELRGLVKSFELGRERVDVLRGVDLELAPGEALAITGPSGSGKSTLLHLAGTLDRPDEGSVRIGGEDPFALPEPRLARFRNRRVGFVFQDHYLLPQYTVLENVLIPTLAFADRGDDERRDESWARELLDRVGLGGRLAHRPAELSGGERQRAAVARALVNRPSLLLCDEPTGNLDEASAAAVADLLIELHAGAGSVMIVVTHSLDLAGRFARRARLAAGRLVEER